MLLKIEICEETRLKEIFYDALIFQQSSMICIGHHVGGHTLTHGKFWNLKSLKEYEPCERHMSPPPETVECHL